jgi:hypothetical protein
MLMAQSSYEATTDPSFAANTEKKQVAARQRRDERFEKRKRHDQRLCGRMHACAAIEEPLSQKLGRIQPRDHGDGGGGGIFFRRPSLAEPVSIVTIQEVRNLRTPSCS